MALVQIEMMSGGRVIWAKLSQAAKLVAQGRARYAAAPVARERGAETAALSPARADGGPPPVRRVPRVR